LARVRSDAAVRERVRALHTRSRGPMGGVPRVHAELATQSARLGRKPIARLMRASGLGGVSRRQAFHTTVRDRNLRPAAKLVEHEFTAPAPGRPSVADISSIPSCVLRSQ